MAGKFLHALLATDAEDRIVAPGQAPYWQRAIPDVRVRLLTSAGHLVLDESAEARQAVSDLLR